MKSPALFLTAALVLTGCLSDSPENSAEVLHYTNVFKAGRRAEFKGDILIADDTYSWLIGRGSRYGEYGRAMLLLRMEPDDMQAVKYLLACAKRSFHSSEFFKGTSGFFQDTAMDSAFSVAAMAKLAEIAISEYDRRDVADSLRRMMSDVVKPEVRVWTDDMKANADSAKIYNDIISAVESCRQSREYVRVLKWPEISKVFLKEEPGASRGCGVAHPKKSYSVVRFDKAPGTTCGYDFEVRLTENGTIDETAGRVRSAIRRMITKEFMDENPHEDTDNVGILFSSWNHSGLTIMGSVEAVSMKVSVVRLEYNDAAGGYGTSGHGKIAVRIGGNDLDMAKKLAIGNIEELATRKNIANVVGRRPPPGARYRTGIERMTDDGLLEIEFDTL